jgi:uncharacterized membrane protein
MAKNENVWPMVGAWAYIIGLVIAILAGAFAPSNAAVGLVLGVIGIIVGLLNITDKEVMLFLIASITFVVAASSLEGVVMSLIPAAGIGAAIASILNYIVIMVAPGAAIVGLKAIYEVSHSA